MRDHGSHMLGVAALLMAVQGGASLGAQPASATPSIAPVAHDFIVKDFRFQSGETLPEMRLHYRTWERPSAMRPDGSETGCWCCTVERRCTQVLAPSFSEPLFGRAGRSTRRAVPDLP